MNACTNCGEEAADIYCARCGERQPSHHDLTVSHFAHETFHELVHLDSKLFRTLRELLFKPGQLTAEYFAGRKKRYIAPLRLFLTLYAITFIAYSVYKPVAMYSIEGLIQMDPQRQLEKRLQRSADKRKIPLAQLTERIDHRWQKNMNLVSLLSIVSLAVLLKLLYLRHRRFLTEHLVFATHYMCFAYVMALLLWPIYLITGLQQSAAQYVLLVSTFLISACYIYLALHRVYGQSGGKTLVKAVAVWAGTVITSMVLMIGSLTVALIQVLRA